VFQKISKMSSLEIILKKSTKSFSKLWGCRKKNEKCRKKRPQRLESELGRMRV